MTEQDTVKLAEQIDSRYRVIRTLDAHGRTVVFLARDLALDRNVTITAIGADPEGDPGFPERFMDAAKAVAGLKSPHVAWVYDWKQLEACSYIVTEHVSGPTLREVLALRSTIEPAKAARIALQACDALAEAHGKGLVHGELTPARIVLQVKKASGKGDVKLQGLGVAGIDTTPADEAGAAYADRYQSPAQAAGELATPADDLFALGAAMYEACTSLTPYSWPAAPDAADAATSPMDELIPPRHLNPAVDPDLNEIIVTALQRDPARRFRSAKALSSALEGYLNAPFHADDGLPLPEYWALTATKGPQDSLGSIYRIDAACTVGNGQSADISIPDGSIVYEHIVLKPLGSYLELENLASGGQTAVDGRTVERKALCHAGSTVEIGDVRLRIGCKW